METIFIVFKANFKRILNDKTKFLISLFVPVIAIALAMFTNYIAKPSINIGVIKIGNFSEENRIISLLNATDGVNVKIADNKLIKTDVILGKYSEVISFKKAFNKEQALANINDYFDFYTVSDKTLNSGMEKLIKIYLVSNKPLSTESLQKQLQKGQLSTAERTISFLATFLLITCVINAASIIKDKQENTFYRFMYSPNTQFQYVLGNVLYNYVFSYIQFFIAIVSTYLIGMRIGIGLGSLLCYGLLLVLVATTFGTLLGCLFKKELYANLFAGSISLNLSLIGGAFIVYDKMPKGLQVLSAFTPIRWVIKSVDLLEKGVMYKVNPMLVLAGFCLIFSVAASVLCMKTKVEFK